MAKFNEYPAKTTPKDADKFMLYSAEDAANKLIDYDKLADAVLNKLTSKTFGLDQGTMTLPAALNQLNSNSFPYRNITSLTDERNVQFRFSVVENITVGTKTIPVYTKGIIMAYIDAIMIGVFGADDTSELYIGYRSQNTWMINCIK